MLCLIFSKEIKLKKRSSKPKIQRFYIDYRPHSPMPALSISMSVLKKIFLYYTRSSFAKHTFYHHCVYFIMYSKWSWIIKLPIKLILILSSWNSRNSKSSTLKLGKLWLWSNYKKARKTSIERFIIRISSTD